MSSSIAELRKRVAETNAKQVSGGFSGKREREPREEDPRLWYPKLDEKKIGYGVIRFLPASKGASVPWAQIYFHRFKTASGKWYVENCPTTFNGKCPVCAANKLLWDSNDDEKKNIARSRKRQLKYFYNILVLQDIANPENNGKNKVFKSGAKIFQMTQDALKPQFPGEVPIDAFDPFESGAPFELKIREYEGNVNYDLSNFMKSKVGPLGNDDFVEKTWNNQFDLREFSSEGMMKNYDELDQIFLRAIDDGQRPSAPMEQAPPQRVAEVPAQQKPKEEKPSEPAGSDDAASWFSDMDSE